MLAASTICYLCGHDGAGAVDHVVPPEQGGDPLDPANLRAVHGSLSRCPWCGRACNEEKGDRPTPPPSSTSRAW